MTLPVLASTSALAARLGLDQADLDDTRATAALEDASALVRSTAKTTWVDEDDELEPVPDDVVTVTLAVARRVYENPKGLVTDTAGPFTEQRSAEAGQALYLTKTERTILGEYRPTTNAGIWTMSTTRTDPAEDNTPLDPTQFETNTGASSADCIPTRGPW